MARGAFAGSSQDAGKELGLEGGLLCQLIRSPDYNLFPNSAVFESNFVQVTKKGKWVDITNTPTIVTLGVTSSDPCLPLPNVLLMAKHRAPLRRVNTGSPRLSLMDLTRLLPLRYVRLSVHNADQRILRIQTVTKKVYYLQLHQEHPRAVFALWSRLTHILQKGLSITTKDPAIRIRHSLVSSRSSSASSTTLSVERSEMVLKSPGVMKRVGRKVSGVISQISRRPQRNLERPRRVSFQEQSLEDISDLSNNIKVLFYDMPPPLVCARCKGRLPRAEPRRIRGDVRHADSDLELAPWTDRRNHGLWQQETPSWLQPLCRLSSLAAAGWK
ncbi:Golgi-associated RAB2 interactor protein 1A [Candoia aspera]|uniref:Golgi-associated RAB2 interactor protein 1A n=1 Tax=Candoia aspera TaxID=51853 RepID=UPI002FD7AC33